MGMRVWIDQDLCTGDALCTEICPSVFKLGTDGLSYVLIDGQISGSGSATQASVSPNLEAAVIEAAEECPGECIYIEAA